MPRKDTIRFELISLAEIPSHPPVAKPVSSPKGSQWDPVLRTLEQQRGKKGVRIFARNQLERNRMKSTLQTMGKNRYRFVEVRDDDRSSNFYAWIGSKEGRFTAPSD